MAIDFKKEIFKLLKPKEEISVNEWASKNRTLSQMTSAQPGKWQSKKYQVEIMNSVLSDAEKIVVKSASQIGKSDCLLNILFYLCSESPQPILYVLPTKKLCDQFVKMRVVPTLKTTPALKDIFELDGSKKNQNTLSYFPFKAGDGAINFGSANSVNDLSSLSVGYIFADEVSRFPTNAGGNEGNVIDLLSARTANFHNRKMILVSTPTDSDCLITQQYDLSDKSEWYCPCVHCGHFQVLKWRGVKWEGKNPETAKYECEKCEYLHNNFERIEILEKGEWRKGREDISDVKGFHVSGLMSPWRSLETIVKQFLSCVQDRSGARMISFVNTTLGEEYEPHKTEQMDANEVSKRVENYLDDTNRIPDNIRVVTCGVDIGSSYISYEIVGYAYGEESYGIETGTIQGNTSNHPSKSEVWNNLSEKLEQFYENKFGNLRIECTLVDSGYMSDSVRFFCRGRPRVYPSKGLSTYGRPIVERTPKKKSRQLVMIGTDTAKSLIYERLKYEKNETNSYMHFPVGRGYNLEFFKELCSERATVKFSRGYKVKKFEKIYKNNEGLDTRVLSLAALKLLMVNWDVLEKKVAGKLNNKGGEVAR